MNLRERLELPPDTSTEEVERQALATLEQMVSQIVTLRNELADAKTTLECRDQRREEQAYIRGLEAGWCDATTNRQQADTVNVERTTLERLVRAGRDGLSHGRPNELEKGCTSCLAVVEAEALLGVKS